MYKLKKINIAIIAAFTYYTYFGLSRTFRIVLTMVSRVNVLKFNCSATPDRTDLYEFYEYKKIQFDCSFGEKEPPPKLTLN